MAVKSLVRAVWAATLWEGVNKGLCSSFLSHHDPPQWNHRRLGAPSIIWLHEVQVRHVVARQGPGQHRHRLFRERCMRAELQDPEAVAGLRPIAGSASAHAPLEELVKHGDLRVSVVLHDVPEVQDGQTKGRLV